MYNGKSNMEIESMVSGTLKSITVPAGQAASVGAQIAIIDESASAPAKEQVKEADPAKSEDKSALNLGQQLLSFPPRIIGKRIRWLAPQSKR